MQKETKKKIKMIVTIILVVIAFMVCYAVIMHVQGKTREDTKIKEKIEEELSYLDANLLAMLNSLHNISYELYKVKTEQTSDSKTSSQTQEEQGGTSNEQQNSQTKPDDNSMSKENSGQSGSEGSQGSSGQGQSQTTETKQSKMQDNGILNTDTNTVDWTSIKQNIEVLYASWNTIAIDLHSVNADQDAILSFQTVMQKAIQAIKVEDKKEALVQLASAYALLPKYSQSSDQKTEKTDIYQTKSHILQAYSLLEQDKWDEIKSNIIAAQEKFMPQMNQVNENETKQANIHKIYMCLKEMETVCDIQDEELFLMNYKEIIQLIENCC